MYTFNGFSLATSYFVNFSLRDLRLSRMVLYFYPVRLNLLMWVCWPNPNLFVLGLTRSVSQTRGSQVRERRGAGTLSLSAGPVTCSPELCSTSVTIKLHQHYSLLLFIIYYSPLIGYFNLKLLVLIDRWWKLNIQITDIRQIFINGLKSTILKGLNVIRWKKR